MESITTCSNADFDAKLKALKNKIVVTHFTADWSEPCTQMNDIIDELAKSSDYSNTIFIKIDTENCPELAKRYNIEAVPTIVFLKDAIVVERLEGADAAQFTRKVKYHNQTAGLLPFSVKPSTHDTREVEDLNTRLKKLISSAPCMVFMKGTPEEPRCGFSKQLVQILNETGAHYKTFDILQDEEVRQGLKTYSNWPTFPQIYVNGELIGGLDIIRELKESGELASSLKVK